MQELFFALHVTGERRLNAVTPERDDEPSPCFGAFA